MFAGTISKHTTPKDIYTATLQASPSVLQLLPPSAYFHILRENTAIEHYFEHHTQHGHKHRHRQH